jgi:hypothetical protein
VVRRERRFDYSASGRIHNGDPTICFGAFAAVAMTERIVIARHAVPWQSIFASVFQGLLHCVRNDSVVRHREARSAVAIHSTNSL